MTSKSSYEELEQRVQTLEKELDSHKIRKDSDRISQQYLEAILNNTNMPIYLKNADYKYIFMNRQLGGLAHVAHDQVQGKDDFAIFPEPTAQLFRSQDEAVVERRALIEFEETILLPDGIQTFMTAKFPLFDNEGKVSAVGGVCTDITDRKKAEADLKEAEEKYRGIFEHSPLGIMHIDKEGIITASNEKLAEILGSRVEDLVGFDLLQSLQEEEARAAIISVLSGQISYGEGCYRSVTGGESPYIRSVFSPISSSDGSIVAAIGIIEDVTSRRSAEEALQTAHDELEQRVADRTAQLDRKTERLMETNVALKILLEKREEDKKELEEKVMYNVEKLIYPWLEKLKTRCNKDSQKALMETIRLNLDEITSSFAHKHNNYLSNLTPAQIQIANFIKQGQTTKEIASLLDLSPSTIACHRQEIRKRLFLTKKKINLQAALTFIP
jgi:PAS domain S-box-containing protein